MLAAVAVAVIVYGSHLRGVNRAHKQGQTWNGPCACVGYVWRGDVRAVSATWTVPTVARNTSGLAGTWIGAESVRGPDRFIQIGVNEGREVPQDSAGLGLPVSDYPPRLYVFWSDTVHHFHPVPLGSVQSGDVVRASLSLVGGRWQLQLTDAHSSLNLRFLTSDDAGPVDQAEWLQEDVAHGSRLYPYPDLSPISVGDMQVNGIPPTATGLRNTKRHVRSTDSLVAGPVHDDAFTVVTRP